MSLRDEPDQIVVPVTEDRAIVIGPAGTKRLRWGRLVDDLTSGEWKSLLRALDPATRSFIESQRLTGCLVELDGTSRKMMRAAEVITEEGGWIQATLRNRGKFTRLMRIRPATGVAAISGGAAILGAIAAQAQTAEMARDIKAIRQRIDVIYQHLQSDQSGAVENAVEQVEDLVKRLRTHGKRGVKAGEFSVIRSDLGAQTRKCMSHLKGAVTKLENAKQRSPRQAQEWLSKGAVDDVLLYLELLGKCYAATVELGLAQIAFEYHKGKPDVARTWAESTTKSTAEFRTEIHDVYGRLGQLDESIRAQFRAASKSVNGGERRRGLESAMQSSASGMIATTVSAAADKLAGKTVTLGRLRGSSIAVPANTAAAGAGVLLLGVVGVNAVVRYRAEKKLDERLAQLSRASRRSSQTLDQAAPSLEMLRTLNEELAGPMD
ncbi:hypothetical protein C1I95_24345 [Micromonospora craterilacus]|uniref:Uncharacterized protein n=1 Tax=Micromonospora craterilacus TaxID=1655439 RepID=A0A2W2EL73_9ACTN|nr:hypothetical protein [Micromonospora craterilacus]PZG13128.1 hypothetical protein C1I95_24345 [Micromonospora craterilacus]